ncbi:NAD(P)/FAD-dependent oxidoreductase [Clostridium sp. BJN0001]|uniref:NAD(P)/FAD-dependent oxidoreductase n=1 Tax=Clostridium sp. BJN0001 TaxID=2930219 RepID=UPI001FD133C5|nr:NAD(P)/FAD-dependent oxidoreductase [Clostridium sp. BJN0001]
MSNVIIVGAGPAGMMAAIEASKKHNVTIVDGNEKVGKKLYITGKGRCNVTNAKDISEFFDYIPHNNDFLYSALYTYTNQNTIDFFEKRGIHLKIERGDRVFPKSDKSSDIIKGLQNELKEKNVKILLNSKVTDIIHDKETISALKINSKDILKGDYFIFATGGCTYPSTGSDGMCHKLLKNLGHNITTLRPSLVPIELKNYDGSKLMGLSLRNVEITIKESGKKSVYKDFGEMLFTHFGVSGPLILSGSRFIDKNKEYELHIDLKPALDEKALDLRIQKDFKKYINKDFKNSLDDLLPQKIIKEVIELSKIPYDKKVNEITRSERRNLCNVIKDFTFKIRGLRPIEEGIVTAGGIDCMEIDPSTMKSKIINNLSFAGELIDVDAFTGGYNVQIAFSTGFIAGNNI